MGRTMGDHDEAIYRRQLGGDLYALEALLEKATPGPWEQGVYDGGTLFRGDGSFLELPPAPNCVPDVRLIVALRNAAPELLSLARRTRQAERERDEWREKASVLSIREADLLVDADASTHWQTRAERAEAQVKALREALEAAESILSDGDYGEDVQWREARDKARAALGGRRSTDALAATSKEDGNATPASTTWPWVLAFAHEMERKLSENRHKGDRDGWAHADALELMSRLRDEVDELHDAICRPEGDQCGCRSVSECYHSQSYDEHEVVSEAADVANFAMMIADVAGRLSPDGPSKEDSDG